MTTNDPNLISRAELARQLRCAQSWISQLEVAGRIVVDGEHVLLKETLERIELTRGNRPDTTARHAESRNRKAAPAGGDAARERAAAELRLKRVQGDIAELERARLAGDVLAREDVERAMRDIGAATRAAMDNFPDQVAPLLLSISSIDEIHALLAEQCRQVLLGLAERLRAINAAEGALRARVSDADA